MSDSNKNRAFFDENIFYITGEFDDEMEYAVVPELRRCISEKSKQKDARIDFIINSHGGNGYLLVQLLELMEEAKRKGVTVRTVVPSHAYSCGSLLAVAGTKGERYIGKWAEHLAHYGQFDGVRKSTPLQISRDSERWKRWTNLMLRHYEEHTNIPDLEECLKDDNFWIPADKCIKWGLADKLISEL